MKEDVIVRVTGWQEATGDTIETISRGSIRREGSCLVIEYEDEALTDEPAGPVKQNRLTVGPDWVEMRRTGEVRSFLRFAAGVMEEGSYETPFGTLSAGVLTRDLKIRESAEGLEVRIRYGLWMNGAFVSECRAEISVR